MDTLRQIRILAPLDALLPHTLGIHLIGPLEEAAAMTSGTRVTFMPGVQALYSEALKNICFIKKVPLIRALHPLMGKDKNWR